MKELTREEIQTRLAERGYFQKDVAEVADRTEQLVCMVIAGTRISQRIVNVISLLLGEDISIQRKTQQKRVKRIHLNQSLDPVEDSMQ